LRRVEVRVPKLGMDTTEAIVSNWLVEVGDHVNTGSPLVELESEKVTFAVESEVTGTLSTIVQPVGATVPVGDLLGILEIG